MRTTDLFAVKRWSNGLLDSVRLKCSIPLTLFTYGTGLLYNSQILTFYSLSLSNNNTVIVKQTTLKFLSSVQIKCVL